MDKARYGSVHGSLVTPSEFIRLAGPNYKERGIFPYCDECQEIVHLYGVHTPNPNVTARFDHANFPPDADPLDDCILANRTERYRGLAPDGWDDQRGLDMRRKFFEDENLAVAYAFCLAMCRAGNLPSGKFKSMLNRADKKRVWAFVGIPLWSIPYILLILENFTATTKGGMPYMFHFSFKKPSGGISSLWDRSGKASKIIKYFSNTGDPVNVADNPFPVSEDALLSKAGDVSWITPNFLQQLKG
jgi:hypothetical protein